MPSRSPEVFENFPKPDRLSTIDQVRWIVEHSQEARICECTLDVSSARLILQVYSRLSPSNQQRLEAMPITAMFTTVCAILTAENHSN